MTTDELNTLAHQIAYNAAKGDIEAFTKCCDDRDPPPRRDAMLIDPEHRWHDLSTFIRDKGERQAVAEAIFYLDARKLLLRKLGYPYMVKIQPELSTGAIVPPTLAEALSA